jgi:hypothetical protein
MMDRPILFSAPMVKAILAGRKTQTRRIVDVPAAPKDGGYVDSYCSGPKTAANPRGMSRTWCWWTSDNRQGAEFKVKCVPGDRLWIRESWNAAFIADLAPGESLGRTADECSAANKGFAVPCGDGIVYRATNAQEHPIHGKAVWRPSIHMPRWASRLTLTVAAVKVERLQEISEADALAEGADPLLVPPDGGSAPHSEGFRVLWESINGAGSWEANLWVACYSFSVEQKNIDA